MTVKAFLCSSPWIHDHICMSNREQGGAGYSKWVSYGGALSDSLQRLDGMHSMRHVAAQQTMSTKIKPEQLPHLLSTSILYIEQAWVPVWRKKTPSDGISYIYIHTACGYINIGCFIGWGMSWTPDRYKKKRHLRQYCIFGNMCWLKGIVKEVN